MTRLARLPTPAFEEKVYTAQENELRRIRHSLSRAAARLGMRGVTVAQSAAEVEAIRQQIMRLVMEAQQANDR